MPPKTFGIRPGWNRLLAAPISLRTVLAARATSSALIALGLLLFIFLVAALFFHTMELSGRSLSTIMPSARGMAL